MTLQGTCDDRRRLNALPLDVSALGPNALGEKFLPITSIIDSIHNGLEDLFPKNILLFCHYAVLRTIESCLAGKYSDFDGHTTSNCCHAMALFARGLIQSVLQLDLNQLQQEGTQKVQVLETSEALGNHTCTWWVPQSLLNLACLYLLGFIKEVNPLQGARTVTKKLKGIAPISTNACNQITHDLQKRFSNWLATSYQLYLENLPEEMHVSGAPVSMWGKYIGPDHLRTDKRGVRYASNLFSMQIALAHLIHSRAKVALINDIIDSSGNVKGRYVCLFEGDGNAHLKVLSVDEIKFLSFFHRHEPVVVFGGCVYSDDLDKDSLSLQMQPWLSRVPNLILACDTFYPQFFKVVDDSEFDAGPIVPSEDCLRTIIDKHEKTRGVSATDPSLYCSTHYLIASMGQVLKIWDEKDAKALPLFFIPGNKLAPEALCAD